MGEVPAPQATPLAPPTSSGGAAQPEVSATHLQGETDGPGTVSEAYSMETQEPEAAKGVCTCDMCMYTVYLLYNDVFFVFISVFLMWTL